MQLFGLKAEKYNFNVILHITFKEVSFNPPVKIKTKEKLINGCLVLNKYLSPIILI